jgi:uncharacterized protein
MRWIIVFICLSVFSIFAEEKRPLKKEYSFYLSGNAEVYHGTFNLFNFEGQCIVSGNYIDGKKIGRWMKWYTEGAPAKQENYVEGVLDGFVYEWHKNGEQSVKREFFKGREHGESNEWHSNGTMKSQLFWRNGLLNGFAKAWHASGNMHKKTYYKKDDIHGYSYIWNNDGKLHRQQFFINGRELKLHSKSEKYGNGLMKLAYSYYIDKDNQEIKHGRYNKWFPNGENWIQCHYFHDKIHGKWAYGKKEGLHSREESWKFGVKHGVFKWFAQGKLVKTQEWRDGEKVSERKLNHLD